jgi:hypothetical protein
MNAISRRRRRQAPKPGGRVTAGDVNFYFLAGAG